MTLLVFSDSHFSLRTMRAAVEMEQPDYVIHLGDLEQDAQHLAQEYPTLAITGVPGNCDGLFAAPLQKLVTYGKTRVLMSHGHIWHVKSGYDAAISAARQSGAHILLFGHTHKPYLRHMEDGLWIMNPGSARDGDYGVITLDTHIECMLKHI